jgi:hypothetical protein
VTGAAQSGLASLTIGAGGKFSAQQLPHWLHAVGGRGVVVDLRQMQWIEPAGLVAIATIVQRATAEGHPVQLLAPLDGSRANYLSRMRVGATVSALGGQHELPIVREWQIGDSLIELTQFTGARGAERMAGLVHDRLLEVDHAAASAMHAAICEVGQNVPHHSGQATGFVAAQVLNGGQKVQFAIADSGLGLRANLAVAGATDDVEASDLAVEDGVSGTGLPGRGHGLPATLQALAELRGSLRLVSGRASAVYSQGERTVQALGVTMPGTLIQGTVLVPDPART